MSVVDPVSDLLSGPQITTATATLADMTKGRTVQGLATDGVAQVVMRIPATAVGEQFAVTLPANQCSGLSNADCVDEYGLLFDPTSPPANIFSNQSGQSFLVTAVSTMTGPMAFAAYRAPVDFVRPDQSAADSLAAQRQVTINVTSQQSGHQQSVQLQLVRPPVVFVHGFNSNAAAWDTFEPFLDHSLFHFYRVEYGDDFPYAGGTYDPALPLIHAQPKNSHFGLDYNACPVLLQIDGFVTIYKSNDLSIPVASVTADIIVHSMGGLLIKYGSQQPCFRASSNYNLGAVHKLITLGTPYFGTPQAVIQLAQSSSCSRSIAASPPANTFAISTFTPPQGGSIIGAVSDLQGTGTENGLSRNLQTVNSQNARSIPTAVVAGDMGTYELDVNNLNALDLVYSICGPTSLIEYADARVGLTSTLINGYATAIGGAGVQRERDGPVIVPGVATAILQHFTNDSYAFYLTQSRFLTQFDPAISAGAPASGSVATNSDASVPTTSAQGGYATTTLLNDHLHSVGWQTLLSSPTVTPANHLQNSSQAASLVQQLLNTTISSSQFNRQ